MISQSPQQWLNVAYCVLGGRVAIQSRTSLSRFVGYKSRSRVGRLLGAFFLALQILCIV